MGIDILVEELRGALIPAYLHKNPLIDGIFAGPQAERHLRNESVNNDGSDLCRGGQRRTLRWCRTSIFL